MKLNLKQLEAFIWVCDLQSFRKAAQRLNTTQPNVSARIAKLEQVLGARLLHRDAGSVRITAPGAEVLNHAREILRATDDLLQSSGQTHLAEGVLKLGVTELVVNTWLRQFLIEARKAYPKLSIELSVDLSIRVSDDLFNRSIDLAFQSGPFDRATSGYLELESAPYSWVAAPQSSNEQGNGGQGNDLFKRLPILAHTRGTRAFTEIEEHFSGSSRQAVTIVPSNNMAACLHMAIDGLGVAVLPESMVSDHINKGDLVQINHKWAPSPLDMCARYDASTAPAYVAEVAALAQQIVATSK